MKNRNDKVDHSTETTNKETVADRRSLLRNIGAAGLGVLAVDALTTSKNAEAAVVAGQVITHIATVADLRTVNFTLAPYVVPYDGQQFEILGYTDKGKGGGIVYYDANDLLSSDNGVTVFVNGIYRFKRPADTRIDIFMAGAKGDDFTNDQPAFQRAIDAGIIDLIVPSATYKIASSIVITNDTKIRNITGIGLATLKLYTAVANTPIFNLPSPYPYPSKQFLTIDNLVLDGENSGLYSYGIFSQQTGYSEFNNIRCTKFSGAGIELRGCVYVGISNFTANSCFYGLHFQVGPAGAPCTTVRVDRAYINGSTRGITQIGAVDMVYSAIVLENCGSSTTTDGALHFTGGTCTLIAPYFEANKRNVVSQDVAAFINTPYGWGTGIAADVFTYSGLPAAQQGWTLVNGYNTYTPRINADVTTNRDLVIGTNLTVPVAGGSVQFGNETMLAASGTLTSGVWTTVYTIPAAEVTGTAVNVKAMYEYTCYAGAADLSTGFDSGTIMNSTLRSYSGAVPGWLRLSSNLVQMKVTNSSYGLSYKIVMRRVYPG